jgi:hypothetical protein
MCVIIVSNASQESDFTLLSKNHHRDLFLSASSSFEHASRENLNVLSSCSMICM